MERPEWAKIRSRTILTQTDRVRLGRNFDWPTSLGFTLDPYPKGKGFHTKTIEIDDVGGVLRKKQKKPNAKKAAAARAKKRKRPVEEESEDMEEEEEISYEVPTKKRVREDPAVIEKFKALCEEAKQENDKSIKKWIQVHYSKFWKSITYTGKQQALRCLANLLSIDP